MIKAKRIYDDVAPEDGFRVLVDRLWPRGVTKDHAAVDLWLKDVAPSSELRKWYHADFSRWDEFCARYDEELQDAGAAVDLLRKKSREGNVTLLYAAKNTQQNHALALQSYLEKGRTRP